MLATCTGDTGLDGLACVLEGFGLGCGMLWVGAGEGTMVGSLQRAGEEERGVPGAVSSSPPFLTARVGAEGAGLDRGVVQEHGYRLRANGNSDLHSELRFARFLSARCSTKCPQEFQISNFENFHFG
jgi:hypothetical protein